jgi:exosortase F-associated protein
MEINKTIRILLIGFLIGALIFVRGFVAPYFYDPLREYFKNDYLYNSIPSLEFGNYFFHLFLRFSINTIISLTIIKLIFNDNKILIFVLKFYLVMLILFASQLFFILKFELSNGYILVFYLRRFLIHPIFLFILLPAIYYQKRRISK